MCIERTERKKYIFNRYNRSIEIYIDRKIDIDFFRILFGKKLFYKYTV